MILNSAPQDQVVMSNVGEVGDFKIKASAKAFNILSSGLYANKIRAIIRELSCNAVDSHTAAGKGDVPFEVHLPTALEPYFSIRDFGTGLNHDQVTSIYTTYFESTKTNSNDYIGALGLGSKSPFSYTDNFTVTAIKDGIKGIYSAFINGDGVPSIVKMGEEETTEIPGVEIKFSVNDRWDFSKFYDEAQNVYSYFKLRPVVTGQHFEFNDVEYETENIIPGVHSTKHNGATSRAVMGNIAYPIAIPDADKSLGDLRQLLSCGLVMEFGIGELDFQASREGLSYIPQTIDAIKRKLESLNAQLAVHIAEEADKLTNKWDRSCYLYSKKSSPLWINAVNKYVNDTNFDLYETGGNARWRYAYTIKAPVDTLVACNMMIRAFASQQHLTTMTTLKHDHGYCSIGPDGKEMRENYWSIDVEAATKFVINDTKVGALERAKHHWRTDTNRKGRDDVYVLEPIDRTKPMLIEAFKNLIANPPLSKFVEASTLRQKERTTGTGMGKNVTIMQLEKRGGSRYHSSSAQMVWRDGGELDSFDSTKTHYYIPLLGFAAQLTKFKYVNPHYIAELLPRTGIAAFDIKIYGVRKGDIDTVKSKKNWVNLEEHIESTLKNLGDSIFIAAAAGRLASFAIMGYNVETIVTNLDDTSPAKTILSPFVGLPKQEGYEYVRKLMESMNIKPKVDVPVLIEKFKQSLREFSDRYPLVSKLGSYANEDDVVSYVKLIDEVKGV